MRCQGHAFDVEKYFLLASFLIIVIVISTTALAADTNTTTTNTNKPEISANIHVENPQPEVSTAAPLTTTTRRPLLQGIKLPCTCTKRQCGCCSGMLLDRFRQKACMNMTYDPDDFSITASMSMNERIMYKNTFSGKHPDPMCIRVPRFRFIEFCVEFSNIYLAQRNLHMCIDAEATWEDFTLIEWSFDCVRMGANGFAVIGPADGGGIVLQNLDEDEEIEDYDENVRSAVTQDRGRTKDVDYKTYTTINKLSNGWVEINLKKESFE